MDDEDADEAFEAPPPAPFEDDCVAVLAADDDEPPLWWFRWLNLAAMAWCDTPLPPPPASDC